MNSNKEYSEHMKQFLDFYIEDGKRVFTAKYHLKRGYCCNNKCRHCPYKQELFDDLEKKIK